MVFVAQIAEHSGVASTYNDRIQYTWTWVMYRVPKIKIIQSNNRNIQLYNVDRIEWRHGTSSNDRVYLNKRQSVVFGVRYSFRIEKLAAVSLKYCLYAN